ncbi:MAG: hypothetical protein E6H82_11740 [Chloroflexi bacterium]|nr:MAG: hypothetical protein E6H82_11740 [Chloroflexota bacterium]
MPDLSHLWQRFVLASALIFGLLLGVAATVFGYSNTGQVAVGWSVFRLDGVPLHHFTEHMRHRKRVHELEAEVTSLRAHLDKLLEMPDQSLSRFPAKQLSIETISEPAPDLPEPVASNGDASPAKKARKRVSLTTISDPEPATASVPRNGEETAPREEKPAEA